MAINQHSPAPGPMFIARPYNGMTFRGYKLRLQTDPVELVHQPVCTLDQLFLVLVVSRDAWKPQERIILLEIIVAHGRKLDGKTPTFNAQRSTPHRGRQIVGRALACQPKITRSRAWNVRWTSARNITRTRWREPHPRAARPSGAHSR